MGTRALIHIADYDGAALATIYVHSDGYPSGVGAKIKETLGRRRLVNGLGSDNRDTIANGMGCAAMLLAAGLKDGPGGFYLQVPTPEATEAFTYHVRSSSGGMPQAPNESRAICLSVAHYGRDLWVGDLSEFDPEAVESRAYDDGLTEEATS